VDDVQRYRNNGQWTDFYFAFLAVRSLVASYPKGSEFKIVLLTDAIVDPSPEDWADMGVPPGGDRRRDSIQRTLDLLAELRLPLYVILVGDIPPEGVVPGNREQAPALVLDMVRTANGVQAAPFAQSLAAFFQDDGVLLKKFVFRVAPHEGLGRLEPVVRRIAAPATPVVELKLLSSLVLPLALFLLLLLGILVRTFPGPGDVEVVELHAGVPVHLAVDRTRRVDTGGWGTSGLSLLPDSRGAAASVTYQAPPLELGGIGLDRAALDDISQRLLPLGIEELGRTLDAMTASGSKEEKIYALNLDYIARNFDPVQAEKILHTPPSERRALPAIEFLRAKAHLLSNAELRTRLLEPRVHMVGYGRGAERKDLLPGSRVRIGHYGFMVKDVARGGRKDVRLVLNYDRVPSLLGLKNWLPGGLQRLVRLRRGSQRVVA
jgi:hypothetical protein